MPGCWFSFSPRGTLLAAAAVFMAVVSSPRAASAADVNIYMGQVSSEGVASYGMDVGG